MVTNPPPPESEAEANPASVARNIILRQLTHSPKSRKQLEEKLAQKDVPADVAKAVLDRFEEVKLVDDAEFAHMWVRSRAQNRSLARGALKRELARKGISEDIAQEALAQVSDQQELESAKGLLARKIQPSMNLADRAERDKYTRRWVAMLARKGYSPGLAFSVVGQIIDEHLEESGNE